MAGGHALASGSTRAYRAPGGDMREEQRDGGQYRLWSPLSHSASSLTHHSPSRPDFSLGLFCPAQTLLAPSPPPSHTHTLTQVEPWLRERVTLSSEIGRPAAALRADFPRCV
jgi:hypothetical protein